jgi:hypothetical protein
VTRFSTGILGCVRLPDTKTSALTAVAGSVGTGQIGHCESCPLFVGGGSGDRRRRLHPIQESGHDVVHGVAVVFVQHVVQVAGEDG